MPATAIRSEIAPVKQCVSSLIIIDGRRVQAITEFWEHKPADAPSWHDPSTDTWFTTRLYDPFTREEFSAVAEEIEFPVE